MMSGQYDKPSAEPGGVRLHLNENTAGCSPAVHAVLCGLTAQDAAFYPDYDAAQQAVARAFGVSADHVLLTNGLDEGILAAAGAALRDRTTAGVPEALGVAPSFDMYEICTEALGGRMVSVALGPEFEFPWDGLRKAMTSQTRIVFLTNPHNPTAQTLPLDELRRLARDIAPAMLFVDEAYADFSGETLIDANDMAALPNLIVGRTFAKAYGLAGLRAGAVVGHPDTLLPLRRVVPPYSLNAYATAALPVALADEKYRGWYLAQVAESKRLLTGVCERLGLRTWPSATNFMLVHAGDRAASLVEALAARRVFVRDRSKDPGCDGCIRMTTGTVRDTERLVAALEEAWCAARR
jgi:histidinol-phosphate aminotransferase